LPGAEIYGGKVKFKRHKKHKVTRKELKEDKFMKSITNFIQDFRLKKDKFIWGIIGVLIFALIVFYYFNHRKNTILQADNIYTFAVIQYGNGKFQEVEPQFIRLTQEFSGTVQGKRALFFLANIHYFEGKIDTAKMEYTKFIKLKFDPLFTPSAYQGIAQCLEEKGKLKEAMGFYKKAVEVSKSDFQKYDAYSQIARLSEQMGDISEAENLYNKILSLNLDSALKKQAERRLKILKGIRASIGG